MFLICNDASADPVTRRHASPRTQINSKTPAIPSHTEGRFAIVTDMGHGMRWTRQRQIWRVLSGCRINRCDVVPRLTCTRFLSRHCICYEAKEPTIGRRHRHIANSFWCDTSQVLKQEPKWPRRN